MELDKAIREVENKLKCIKNMGCGFRDCNECEFDYEPAVADEAAMTVVTAVKEAQKYAWHDLRKNPDDLPCAEEPVLILDGGSYMVTVYGKVYNPLTKDYLHSESSYYKDYLLKWHLPQYHKQEDVLAWRYIELFEGDVNNVQ